jgi:hypothetical protein
MLCSSSPPAHQSTSLFASPISTRSPNGRSSTSSNSDNFFSRGNLFPFLYDSAFTASRPSRELLVNGRCPEHLQGLIGSPYSRRKYSGTKCHPATIPQAMPIPQSRPHRGPPTLGIIGTVHIPRCSGMPTPSL